MPLAGETLFLVGRIQGLTRRRLDTLVRLREGKLATRPGRTVSLIAFGHSTARSTTAASPCRPACRLRRH